MDENAPDAGLVSMIADYMEKGFLENIIDMFRHDSSLFGAVGELIQDERLRVRIGITALIEVFASEDTPDLKRCVAGLLPLLDHKEAVVRGDAVNLLGLTGDAAALPHLTALLNDEDPSVRMLSGEAIDEIRGKVSRA